MAKSKSKNQYVCSNCGYKSIKWLGNCPECSAWSSFEEEVFVEQSTHRARLASNTTAVSVQKLNEIEDSIESRWTTGISEFDRAMGGGMVRGAYILLGGDPGIGKSTLMLQVAGKAKKKKMFYVSGEESLNQIKSRAIRLGINQNDIYMSTETEVEAIIRQAEKLKPDFLVIDSIQTLYRSDVNSLPGSVAQIRESAVLLQQYAKKEQVSTLLIGHVTKDGGIAGPRLLEHMVDAVLYFEGDNNYRYRFLRSVKNRFGRTGEVGVFEMTELGLDEVKNPSALFLADRNSHVSGSAIVPVLEGSRAVLIEVQALVSKANYGQPQRTANGYDHKRLAMMLAILEKRCGYPFGNQDVFLNLAGGLKTDDRALDLAVCVSLVSAMTNKTIQQNALFVGEIGLGGELRAVSQTQLRIKEAERMGFRTAYIPPVKSRIFETTIQLENQADLQKVLEKLFS